MFFFFFGGLSNEVRLIVEKNAARCLRCGGPADLVEYDKVLRAFFIPIWRWPGDGLGVNCNNCKLLLPSNVARIMRRAPEEASRLLDKPSACPSCSSPLSPSFRYCPQCGSLV